MNRFRQLVRSLCALFLVPLSLGVAAQVSGSGYQPKIPPKYPAAPDEIAQLPKYCYQQYVDGSLGGRTYSIPSDSCGYAMNHFCPALVYMMRSQKLSLRKAERAGAARNALKDINYTIHDMKPGCFITQDVMAAKQKAEMMVRMTQ